MWTAWTPENRIVNDLETGFLERLFRKIRAVAQRLTARHASDLSRIPLRKTVELQPGEHFAMVVSSQCRIACTAGAVWVTHQKRICDYILEAGESLRLQRSGKVIVSGGRKDTLIRIWCS